MPLQVAFSCSPRGNTIPYPPMRTRGRSNAGFLDLRDQPNLASEVHEALRSPALRCLLQSIAASKRWMSLGSEIGSHVETKGSIRHYTGGYIQVITREPHRGDCGDGEEEYRQIAEAIAEDIQNTTRRCDWRLVFEVGEIAWRLDSTRHEPNALWIWFWAGAPTASRAECRRERLVREIGTALLKR
jgi:hypothetical protein